MLLNMVMFKVTICDFGKMNINMTDKMKKSIFILGSPVKVCGLGIDLH